ncbi:murein L,D-transpeptidase catalytic domain family protein [Viscerimonas tarda]
MRRFFIFLFLLLVPFGYSSNKETAPLVPAVSTCYNLYTEMHLQHVINYAAFEQAILGYNKIDAKNKDILSLIDFSKPSTKERLYILDMKQKRLLYSSLVSHGKNSGENYATSFSNQNGSYKSSLGFYVTENTYQGKNGYSLILDGLERGVNDKAKERAIVIHGASYSNPSVIASSGRLGRSLGCPAIPQAMCQKVIDTIKGGTILFIYANDKTYAKKSPVLSSYVFQ